MSGDFIGISFSSNNLNFESENELAVRTEGLVTHKIESSFGSFEVILNGSVLDFLSLIDHDYMTVLTRTFISANQGVCSRSSC